jgi:hypothetical protein
VRSAWLGDDGQVQAGVARIALLTTPTPTLRLGVNCESENHSR